MGKVKAKTLSVTGKDVVIAGAGGSGIAAALMLAEGEAKVVVFEKMPLAGGSTVYVEGTFAAESEMQWKRNIRVTRDQAFKEMMEYSHWRANAALARAIVDKSGGTISWLEKQGVEFIEPSADWPGGPRVWHLYKGLGGAMMKVLVANAIKKGVEIHYETSVKRLVREGNGPVTGVIVEDKAGKTTKVEAKAVIIATGGYANNKEWIKKYTGFDLGVNLFPLGYYDKTGDGIEMAWAAGAAEEGIEVLLFSIGTPRGFGLEDHMLGAAAQPMLWINRNGVRFCDEDIIENMIHTGNAMSRQPGGYIFKIFDENTRKYWAENGGFGAGMYCAPRTPLTKLGAEMKKAVRNKNPNVFIADTPEELADKMGVDRKVFKKTVEEYNGFCDKGHDDQFATNPVYLRPVRTPQLYALKCFPDFLGTHGGIKINERTEVLDGSDKVIPGLYAVGNDAGGIFGDSYDINASGIGSSFAINSGRIAGENALIYTKTRRIR